MNAFRKWILEDEDPVLSIDAEIQREKGWRAALEWVLKMFLRGDSFGSIVAKIKAELGIK